MELAALSCVCAGCAGLSAREPTVSPEAEPGQARESADALMARGVSLAQGGSCERAIAEGFGPAAAAYEAIIREELGPGRPRFEVARAPSGASSAAVSGAGDDGGPAVVRSPLPDAIYLHAFCLVALGRYVEAERKLELALAYTRDDVVYLSELGHLLHLRKDWEGALEVYRRALANAEELERSGHFGDDGRIVLEPLSSWMARALRGQGFSLIELGRFDEAEQVYRRALEIDPNDPIAAHELGAIEERRQGRGRSRR